MRSSNCIPLIGLVVAMANGCAQFPTLSPSDAPTHAATNGREHSVGVMQLGDDPDAFRSPINPAERRADLLITRARLAIADGENDNARNLLEGILDAEPKNAEASHLIAVLETQAGELEPAEAHFRTALAGDDRNPELNCDYGYFCYLAGRWDDAERYLTRALELKPDLAHAQTNLGMIEARRGDSEAAEERFRNAGCNEVQVLNNLALARFLEEDFDGAESLYRRALKLDPENSIVNDGLEMARHMSQVVAEAPATATVSLAGTAAGEDR